MIRYIVCFVIIVKILLVQSRVFDSSEGRLIAKLGTNYNADVPPIQRNGKIGIAFGITLTQVISLNEKAQELTIACYTMFEWNDTRLTWDPSEFENIEKIRLPTDLIWTPQLLLTNSKDAEADIAVNTMAICGYNGFCEWLPPALYQSTCQLDVSMFPFDEQNCYLKFQSPDYTRDELEFSYAYKGYADQIQIDDAAYQANGEWDLTVAKDITYDTDDNDPSYLAITFHVNLKRMPQFYIMNSIIPMVLMSMLSCLVFYLPSISCEKMTVSISILLGETVFFSLIAKKTPETSMAIPLIGSYLLFVLCLVIISVIASVICCNITFRSKITHKMPKWMSWFFFDIMAPFLRVERPDSGDDSPANTPKLRRFTMSSRSMVIQDMVKGKLNMVSPSEQLFDSECELYGFPTRKKTNYDSIMTDWDPSFLKHVPMELLPVVQSIQYIARQKKLEDEKGGSEDDWAYVALIIDRILLWIYTITFLIGTVVVLA